MKIVNFFKTDYCDFASYDVIRKIGSYLDGFKTSSRKIVFTMNQKYKVDRVKLSQLANATAECTQYLHGENSLTGVAVGLAQDFPGTNNVNVLLPEGSFGNRLIQEAAAPRYIYTKRAPIFDKIFIKEDEAILKTQVFEGSEIEYHHYIPIIPMILVNGSSAISVGFAQNIFPRNPLTIIDEIKKCLKTNSLSTRIPPWYKGFGGSVVVGESIEVRGKVERYGHNCLKITEIPIGYDLKSYTKILNDLEDDKIIKSYKDLSQKNVFAFEVKLDLTVVDINRYLTLLKLIKKDKENFTCLDENNEIIVFNNEVELLGKFIGKRLSYYKERKEYQLSKLRAELTKLAQVYKFISAVIEGKLIVFKRKKDEIIADLESLGIEKIDDSYEYLLNLKVADFTYEQLEDLKSKFNTKKNLFQDLKLKTINNIYIEELDALSVELKKMKVYG